MLRGWHGIRNSWRRCGWIGCAEPLVTEFSHLCPSHIREADRLADAFKRAQLEFEFVYKPVAVVVQRLPLEWMSQIAFDFPRPRLRGSRKPLPETHQLRKKTPVEIERDEWNRLKKRMLDKKDIKRARTENRERNRRGWRVKEAEWTEQGW